MFVRINHLNGFGRYSRRHQLTYVSVQSDPVNPLKIFKVAAADILPRIPKNITTLAAIFPSASTNIPAPLTAAFASTTPLRVYFIGGLSGAQTIGQYQYSSSNVFTVIGSPSTTVSSQWNEDIKAATTYFNVITGTNQYFLFSINQTARINTSLAVSIVVNNSYQHIKLKQSANVTLETDCFSAVEVEKIGVGKGLNEITINSLGSYEERLVLCKLVCSRFKTILGWVVPENTGSIT